MEIPVLGLFATIGVFNAWVVGGVLIFRRDLRREPGLIRLALLLLAIGILLAVFTVWNLGWLGYFVGLRVVHDGLALAIGPLFLDHVRCVLRGSPLNLFWYLPTGVYLILALIFGLPWIEWVTIEHLVVVQMFYSIYATAIYVQTRLRHERPRKEILFLFIAIWVLHGAQLARMLVPDSRLIFDMVPIVGAALLISLNVYILSGSQVLRRVGKGVGFSDSPIKLGQLRAYVEQQKSYLDPEVTVENLADGLDVSSKQISALINASTGSGFYDFLNQYRVEEAKGLLTSPEERRTSIEAIGIMAGFKSRSTFYAAFRKATGSTPARYREIN